MPETPERSTPPPAVPASPSTRFVRNLALVIGIDRYEGGVPVLRTAVRDARAVGHALETRHGFEVMRLVNHRATRATVTSVLGAITGSLTQNDRLLVYYAGHGLATSSLDEPAGYVLLHDAVRSNPTTFLPMRELHEVLAAIPCRHMLLVLDCCFAGTFRWASYRDVGHPEPVPVERYDRFVQSPAWQVLTSAAGDQQALDVFPERDGLPGSHSPFAAALLAGLAGSADLEHDGLITATELYWYLRAEVERSTGRSHRLQTPGLFPLRKHEHGEFVFQVPDQHLRLKPAIELDANPYRGLNSYRQEDSRLFFGRSALALRLHEWVRVRSFTLVVGPSGCGKSSLVNAGVVPRFSDPAGRPEDQDWSVIGPVRAADAVRAGLHQAELPTSNVVVVIDQLEELFTQRIDLTDRSAFLAALARWSADPTGRVHVVVTLRSDFEALLRSDLEALHHDAFPMERWEGARFIVPPMTRDQLREAVEGPPAAHEIYFHPARLADQLVHEVAGMPGALPLLSFALSEIYVAFLDRFTGRRPPRPDDAPRPPRAITEADLAAVGGVARALTRCADSELASWSKLHPAYLHVAKNVMTRMVARDHGELVRRRVWKSELEFADAAQVEALLRRFIAARLLVSDAGPDATLTWVEPAHDALVLGWDQLRTWRDEAAETEAVVSAVGAAAMQWAHHKHAPNLLWHRDKRLDQLVEIARAHPHPLNLLETRFVRRSRWRRVRNRLLAAGEVAAIIVGLVVAQRVVASVRDRADANARVAESRALVVQSSEYIAADPGLAATLAIEAFDRAPTQQSEAGLFSLLNRRPFLRTILPAPARSLAFSFDGRVLATVVPDGVSLWNVQTGTLREPTISGSFGDCRFLPGDTTLLCTSGEHLAAVDLRSGHVTHGSELGSEALQLAVSDDGRLAATGNRRGQVTLWDPTRLSVLAVGEPLSLPKGPDNLTPPPGYNQNQYILQTTVYIRGLVFLRDSKTLLAVSEDGRVQVWDTETRRIIVRWDADLKDVTSLARSRGEDDVLIAGGRIVEASANASRGPRRPPKLTSPVRIVTARDGSDLVYADAEGVLAVASAGFGAVFTGTTFRAHVAPPIALATSNAGTFATSSGEWVAIYDVVRRHPTDRTEVPSWPERSRHGAIAPPKTTDTAGLLTVTSTADVPSVKTTSTGTTRVLAGAGAPITSLEICDSRWLSAGLENGQLAFWDLTSGALTVKPGHRYPAHVACRPGTAIVASHGGDGQVRIWDAATAAELHAPYAYPAVTVLAFSPSGRLGIGLDDGAVSIRDLAAPGDPEIAWSVGYRVTALRWIDDRWLVTAAMTARDDFDTMEVRLWEADAKTPVGEAMRGSRPSVLAYDPDTRILSIAWREGPIGAVSMDPAHWRTAACELALNLTQREWNLLIPTQAYHETCPGRPIHAPP